MILLIAQLTNAIYKANFFNAWLLGVDIVHVYSTTQQIFQAHLEKVILSSGNLSGISFENSQLIDISFKDVDLTGANFAGATLQKVSFLGCNLAEVDFTNVIVEGFICVDKDLDCVKWHEDKLSSFSELGNLLKQRTEQQQQEEDDIFDGFHDRRDPLQYNSTNLTLGERLLTKGKCLFAARK